jgi:hypothetical protein
VSITSEPASRSENLAWAEGFNVGLGDRDLLLAALKAVLYKYVGDGETPDGDMRAYNEAIAAIAKAEGA